MSRVFLVAAVVSALWGVVAAIGIAAALDRRGIRVNPFLFRLFFFRYLSEYRSATLRETGKVGALYRSYITAMVVALACAVIGLLLRLM